MTRHDGDIRARVMGWRQLAVCILAIIAASGAALWLIEPVSLQAAIRGALSAIFAIVFTQLALRWHLARRRRRQVM